MGRKHLTFIGQSGSRIRLLFSAFTSMTRCVYIHDSFEGNRSMTVEQDIRALEARIRVLEAMIGGPTITLRAAGGSLIIGPNGLTIESGLNTAKVVMNNSGDLSIAVKDFNVSASGRISCKASGELTLKGSKVLTN
jgi:hypothetical protein